LLFKSNQKVYSDFEILNEIVKLFDLTLEIF
jgi:hypothetical protein